MTSESEFKCEIAVKLFPPPLISFLVICRRPTFFSNHQSLAASMFSNGFPEIGFGAMKPFLIRSAQVLNVQIFTLSRDESCPCFECDLVANGLF
jgi:hypothetical protein